MSETKDVRIKALEEILALSRNEVLDGRASEIAAEALAALEPAPKPAGGEPLTFGYTNWRGEFAVRSAIPMHVHFGTTEWHPEPQWLLRAFDVEKQAERDFAMKDMRAAFPPPSTGAVDVWELLDAAAQVVQGVASLGVDREKDSVEPLHINLVDDARDFLREYAAYKRSTTDGQS